jgi:hypothetical protein
METIYLGMGSWLVATQGTTVYAATTDGEVKMWTHGGALVKLDIIPLVQHLNVSLFGDQPIPGRSWFWECVKNYDVGFNIFIHPLRERTLYVVITIFADLDFDFTYENKLYSTRVREDAACPVRFKIYEFVEGRQTAVFADTRIAAQLANSRSDRATSWGPSLAHQAINSTGDFAVYWQRSQNSGKGEKFPCPASPGKTSVNPILFAISFNVFTKKFTVKHYHYLTYDNPAEAGRLSGVEAEHRWDNYMVVLGMTDTFFKANSRKVEDLLPLIVIPACNGGCSPASFSSPSSSFIPLYTARRGSSSSSRRYVSASLTASQHQHQHPTTTNPASPKWDVQEHIPDDLLSPTANPEVARVAEKRLARLKGMLRVSMPWCRIAYALDMDELFNPELAVTTMTKSTAPDPAAAEDNSDSNSTDDPVWNSTFRQAHHAIMGDDDFLIAIHKLGYTVWSFTSDLPAAPGVQWEQKVAMQEVDVDGEY